LLVATLVTVVNLSAVLTTPMPDIAASLFFANTPARAQFALERIVRNPDTRTARLTIALARTTVERDATAPFALSAAALAFELVGEPARTRPLMALAEQLSRRNLPLHLWMIQDAVERQDVAGALGHFDAALRTSRKAAPILMPVLLSALDDRRLVVPIAKTLARNPSWRPDFTLESVSKGSVGSASALAIALAQLESKLPDAYVSILMLRLSRSGDYSRASELFHTYFPTDGAAGIPLRDEGFMRPGARLPFGWQFADGSDLGVAVTGHGHPGAQLYAKAGASGEAARHLVMLSPGSYRVQADFADAHVVGGGEPRWQIVCGQVPPLELAAVRLAAGQGPQRAAASFMVPPHGCPAQWIFLTIPPSSGDDNVSVDLARLSIRRFHQ